MGRGALVAALLFSVTASAEGGVRGTVKLVSVLPDGSKKPLPDASPALVYIPDFEQPAKEEVGGKIEQKDKAYVPDVLAIVKGQSVEFVNQDPFLHNVFSNSKASGRKGMDLGKYQGPGNSRSWKFTKTGFVDLYCDIHESMAATVAVLPNPAFTRPDPSGTFSIGHLPAGHHVVYVWARHGTRASADVEIKDGQVAQLAPLVVEITGGGTEPHLDRYGREYSRHAKGYGQ
jgi:plastocyanin